CAHAMPNGPTAPPQPRRTPSFGRSAHERPPKTPAPTRIRTRPEPLRRQSRRIPPRLHLLLHRKTLPAQLAEPPGRGQPPPLLIRNVAPEQRPSAAAAALVVERKLRHLRHEARPVQRPRRLHHHVEGAGHVGLYDIDRQIDRV